MGVRFRPPTFRIGVGAITDAEAAVPEAAVSEVPEVPVAPFSSRAEAISSRLNLSGFCFSKESAWSQAYTRGPALKVT